MPTYQRTGPPVRICTVLHGRLHRQDVQTGDTVQLHYTTNAPGWVPCHPVALPPSDRPTMKAFRALGWWKARAKAKALGLDYQSWDTIEASL